MSARVYQVIDLDTNAATDFGTLDDALEHVDDALEHVDDEQIARFRVLEDDHELIAVDRAILVAHRQISTFFNVAVL